MSVGDRLTVATEETQKKIYDLLSVNPVYGFVEKDAILGPGGRIEYIGMNKDYTPMTANMTTHQVSQNSWSDFPLLKANQPYMVHSDGTPDYKLDPNDYTKKEGGGDSDVANPDYDGGAFAWIMKIYKQEYMKGTDRVVNFSFQPLPGFEPVGFMDGDNELEGVWMPMFYGALVGNKMRSTSGTQPIANKDTPTEKAAIDAFSARARFYGGAIVHTIIDLMILFSKTSDLQAAFGYGNCNGYVNDAAQFYGVKENAVIGGGQFYASSDQKSLNKAFHSIVINSYQQYMRDPYTVCVSGRLKVSKGYQYDVTGDTYEDTGITYAAAEGVYPNNYRVVPGFGAFPVPPYQGSTSLGSCDRFYVTINGTKVAIRFGGCVGGLSGGPRYLDLSDAASHAYWNLGAAVLLLPPVGVAA